MKLKTGWRTQCAQFDTKPKYDSFIVKLHNQCTPHALARLPFCLSSSLFQCVRVLLPSNNLQYDAFMQNFFHKNETNCCVRLFIRKMQQQRTRIWRVHNRNDVKSKTTRMCRETGAANNITQCKYIIPLLHLSSKKMRKKTNLKQYYKMPIRKRKSKRLN